MMFYDLSGARPWPGFPAGADRILRGAAESLRSNFNAGREAEHCASDMHRGVIEELAGRREGIFSVFPLYVAPLLDAIAAPVQPGDSRNLVTAERTYPTGGSIADGTARRCGIVSVADSIASSIASFSCTAAIVAPELCDRAADLHGAFDHFGALNQQIGRASCRERV